MNPDTKTETITTLAGALAAAQSEYPVVPKVRTATIRTKTGGTYEFHYADLSDIFKAILPVLGKHGLAVTQPLRRAADGKLRVITRLMFGADQSIESEGFALPEGLEPQETGILIGYYRRYDACLLLGVAPDEAGSSTIRSSSRTVAPEAKTEAKTKTVEALAFIVDVQADQGKKSKAPYLWVHFKVAGGETEKAIVDDPRLFDTMKAAMTHDAVITMRDDPSLTYRRITNVVAPE